MEENSIINRINLLQEYFDFLDDIVIKETLDSFLSNKQVQLSTERALHVVIEILLDLGNFLINKLKLPKPSTYSEIFKILCENNVLPRDLKDTLIDMAKFRNLLVHGYTKVDATRVYYILIDYLDLLKNVSELLITKIESL